MVLFTRDILFVYIRAAHRISAEQTPRY